MSNVNGKYQHVAVGVSGGVDSLALCLLAHSWGKENGVKITALTVDHGLRKESAREAARSQDDPSVVCLRASSEFKNFISSKRGM